VCFIPSYPVRGATSLAESTNSPQLPCIQAR
jgi:hypothetical protein